MKTSNIIITAVCLSVFVWMIVFTVEFFNQVEEGLSPENLLELGKTKEQTKEIQTNIDIPSFLYLKVSGDGLLKIENSKKCNRLVTLDKNIKWKQQGDTLFIRLKKTNTEIHSTNIYAICADEQAVVEGAKISSDTLRLKAEGNSEINIRDIRTSQLYINVSENSSLSLLEVQDADKIHADISLKDNAEARINKLFDMTLKTKKEDNSRLSEI